MPRLRLPRLALPRNRDRTPGERHDRLVLVAEIAGFVVVTGIVAAFVLMAATSGDDGVAAPGPAVPTITDAGAPESTEAVPEPAPPPPAETIAPPAAGRQAEVVAPKPEPLPPKPTPPSSSSEPPEEPDENDNGPRIGRLLDECAPEGSHAFTKRRHLALVCLAGRWHLAL